MLEKVAEVLPVPSGATVKSIVAMVVAALGSLCGGWTLSMQVLATVVIIDVIAGIARAFVQKTVSSEVAIIRGVKKFLIFVVIVFTAQLDLLIDPSQHTLRDAMIIYYVVAEGISILENTAACGLPYPAWLLTALKQLNERKANPLPPEAPPTA